MGSNPTPRIICEPTYLTETAINYMIYLGKQGLAESTIKGLTRKLARIARNINLNDPDEVMLLQTWQIIKIVETD